VEERLEKSGQRVTHKEGYNQAEWVLLDYVDFVVHIFFRAGAPVLRLGAPMENRQAPGSLGPGECAPTL